MEAVVLNFARTPNAISPTFLGKPLARSLWPNLRVSRVGGDTRSVDQRSFLSKSIKSCYLGGNEEEREREKERKIERKRENFRK